MYRVIVLVLTLCLLVSSVAVLSFAQKPPPPKGTGCSPGFYKNHLEIWVGICCDTSMTPSCAELLTALTCKGSDASCGRSAAAAVLDACTGCSE